MCLRREGHDRRRAGGDAAQRSCRLAGLLPRVRRTSVRDSPQTDGQLSHQAEAASGVASAASRCRRGGRQTPGWATCDSAARWPTSSVPPAIRHVLARGNGTSKPPRADSVRGKRTSGRIPSALLLRNDLGTLVGRYRRFCIVAIGALSSRLPLAADTGSGHRSEPTAQGPARISQLSPSEVRLRSLHTHRHRSDARRARPAYGDQRFRLCPPGRSHSSPGQRLSRRALQRRSSRDARPRSSQRVGRPG
jgi:hypothetical protein